MALRATVRRLGDLKPGVQPHLEIWSPAASILWRPSTQIAVFRTSRVSTLTWWGGASTPTPPPRDRTRAQVEEEAQGRRHRRHGHADDLALRAPAHPKPLGPVRPRQLPQQLPVALGHRAGHRRAGRHGGLGGLVLRGSRKTPPRLDPIPFKFD